MKKLLFIFIIVLTNIFNSNKNPLDQSNPEEIGNQIQEKYRQLDYNRKHKKSTKNIIESISKLSIIQKELSSSQKNLNKPT